MSIVGNSTSRLSLILYEERIQFSIGESVTAKMEAVNHTNQNIDVRGFQFDWDQFVFSSPNDVRLNGPDGDDLFESYRDDDAVTNLITIPAGKSEWFYLPISTFMKSTPPGEYRFDISLTVEGEQCRSNPFKFEITEVESNTETRLVQLIIAQQPHVPDDPLPFSVSLANSSGKALTFLKPQEDSFSGWVNPVYRFKVLDERDRVLQQARRSGTMATPEYDDQSFFTLQPGQSHEQVLRVSDFPGLEKSGTYRISLEYIVRENAIGKGGTVLDRKMEWDVEVFIGRLVSNEIVVAVV